VAQEVWNELCAVGRGARGGTTGAGFRVAGQPEQRPFVTAGTDGIELEGGEWGRGQLIQTANRRWRWQPHVALDSRAFQDQDTWSMRREEMDLRLRLAARIPIAAESLRVTEKAVPGCSPRSPLPGSSA
jgi:hypothetical protein